MSSSNKLLIEKANLIRSISTLLTLSSETPEGLLLSGQLIDSIIVSLNNVIDEYQKLLKLSSLFDSGGLNGELVVKSFFANFLASIFLETLLNSNSSLVTTAPALKELIIRLNPEIELFFKVLNQE